MIKTVLALYLSFVAFVGPGLCCCAFGEWFVSKADSCKTQDSPSRNCCHHAQHVHDSEQSKPHNHNPAPFCPCKQHQEIPVAPSVQAPTLSLLSFAHELDCPLELHVLAIESSCFSVTGICSSNLVNLIQISAHEVLRASFVLLC